MLTARRLILLLVVVGSLTLPSVASAWTVTRSSTSTMYIDTATNNGLLYGSYAAYKVTNDTGSPVSDVWVKADTFSGSVVSLASTDDGLVHVGAMAAGAS